VVEQEGLTREVVNVARFTPAKPVLARPRVRVRLQGAVAIINWHRVIGAVGYEVTAHTADGRWLYFKEPKDARSIRVARVSKIGVTVRTLGPGLERGPAASAGAARRSS
jgi:hypothetical protein